MATGDLTETGAHPVIRIDRGGHVTRPWHAEHARRVRRSMPPQPGMARGGAPGAFTYQRAGPLPRMEGAHLFPRLQPRGAGDLAHEAIAACHSALRQADLWPYGTARRRAGVRQLLAAHGVTLAHVDLRTDALGVLIFHLRTIAYNSHFCRPEALDDGDPLTWMLHDLTALALFSIYLVMPAIEPIKLLPTRWDAGEFAAQGALWQTAWWMAYELMMPGPYLLHQASQGRLLLPPALAVPKHTLLRSTLAQLQASMEGRAEPPGRMTWPVRTTNPSGRAMRDAFADVLDQPDHPFWRSSALAHAYAGAPWSAWVQETIAPLLVPYLLSVRVDISERPTRIMPSM